MFEGPFIEVAPSPTLLSVLDWILDRPILTLTLFSKPQCPMEDLAVRVPLTGMIIHLRCTKSTIFLNQEWGEGWHEMNECAYQKTLSGENWWVELEKREISDKTPTIPTLPFTVILWRHRDSNFKPPLGTYECSNACTTGRPFLV